MKIPKVTSDFAILDVKKGRAMLAKMLAKSGIELAPDTLRIPVVIIGEIDGIWGSDDGTSREFTVTVTSLELFDRQ